MTDKKQLNEEELDKVNGGSLSNPDIIHCPNCEHDFDNSTGEYTVVHGSGCNEKSYSKCPYCEHEFN